MNTTNKIKKGDYVVCIRTYDGTIYKQMFKKNNLYKIREIYNDGYILVLNDKLYSGFELLDDKSNRYFFNYFTTLQQYRKLKLEKINETR